MTSKIDPNHDIVPTLRMFDGLMMNKAADEIERLRLQVAALSRTDTSPVAYEFLHTNGHAIVDYSEHTHAGHLTTEKGYAKLPLVYFVKARTPIAWIAPAELEALPQAGSAMVFRERQPDDGDTDPMVPLCRCTCGVPGTYDGVTTHPEFGARGVALGERPSDEEDGGPEQFARQRPFRKLVTDWLRETMGSVEADNVSKPEFHALVQLVDRAASLGVRGTYKDVTGEQR